MKYPYSNLFHSASKENLDPDGKPIPMDPRDWPESWRTITVKEYPRFKKIPLTRESPHANFFELAKKRKSGRTYSGKPLSKSQVSAILEHSCGITGTQPDGSARRAQPSGGGRYPIEVYIFIITPGGDIAPGFYHYNVLEHSLDVIWERPFTKEDLAGLFSYEFAASASAIITLTGVFERTQIKYGERGYRYVLLEAGHIGQNLYLASQALGLQSTITGTLDVNLEKFIEIDGSTESIVYALSLG